VQTRVSNEGQIVLPSQLRRRLNICAGDSLDVSIEQGRIVLTQAVKPKFEARIIKDPVTGFVCLDLGPDAPVLTSDMVKDLLTDFP